jgi:hypothetical protein
LTKSLLNVRLGSEMPQIVHTPPDVHSLDAAADLIELADAYQIADGPLSPSQCFRIRNAYGERADGSWAATTIGDFGGRQGAGKSGTINVRVIGGLLLFGEELIIHTAHEFPTANESFLRVVSVFENYDDLRKLVRRIRYANGEQGIEMLSGQRLKYRARTGGSGRGFAKANLVVYDEGQHLTGEHVAASGPARLANPNSQSLYAGSGGFSHSLIAWRLRKRALAGDAGRLAYAEHTAERIRLVDGRIVSPAIDPADKANWYMANPGLGRWVTEEAMAALFDELGDLASRELMCVWELPSDEVGQGVVDLAVWDSLAQVSSIESDRCWALAVAPDRSWASLGAAGRNAGGKLHVEWREHRAGTAWVEDRCVDAFQTLRIPVRIRKDAAEASFIEPLRRRGVQVEEVSRADEARATGVLLDAVTARELVHVGQPSLRKSVEGAELDTSSGGSSVFSQRGSVEISPLRAVTVALTGVSMSAALEPVMVLT